MTETSSDSAAQLEEILLGGQRKYTRHELYERSGFSVDYGRRLWRAMGFAPVDDDTRMFTDADLDALRALNELKETGLVDDAAALTSTRAMGQQLSRLADWQVGIVADRVDELGTLDQDELNRLVGEISRQVLPGLERILLLVWRRQLAVHAARALAEGEGAGAGDRSTSTVGFADIVNFTRLSRSLDPDQLAALLERFESRATLHVVECGGQVVKTLGDEVMFTADDPVTGAEIALRLIEGSAGDDREGEPEPDSELRVGLACGPVLARLGDVYGEPVNLASRLTSLARPGSILVDRELAAALAKNAAYELHSLPRQQVRGYRHLEASVLRRRNDRRNNE